MLANEFDLKSTSLKEKLSSFVKTNMSMVNDLNDQARTNIKGRMRSFSLKSTASPDICNLDKNDAYSNLVDDTNEAINFNDIKLVLNKTDAETNNLASPNGITNQNEVFDVVQSK